MMKLVKVKVKGFCEGIYNVPELYVDGKVNKGEAAVCGRIGSRCRLPHSGRKEDSIIQISRELLKS